MRVRHEWQRGGEVAVFFFNDTATTEIYTLSLHDALPIWQHRFASDQSIVGRAVTLNGQPFTVVGVAPREFTGTKFGDRKSTRLNSSHANISYAVFCLKKQNNTTNSSHPSLRPSRDPLRLR